MPTGDQYQLQIVTVLREYDHPTATVGKLQGDEPAEVVKHPATAA